MEKTIQWALRDVSGNEVVPFEAMSDVKVLEAL